MFHIQNVYLPDAEVTMCKLGENEEEATGDDFSTICRNVNVVKQPSQIEY
jgi:hypothetical protein